MKKAIGIILAFILSVIFGWMLYGNFTSLIGVDFNAFLLYKQYPHEKPNSVVIVKIDNNSLDSLTKSDFKLLAFSKQVYLDLFENLENAGAKAIGLDVVLVNEDPLEATLAKKIREYGNIIIAAKIGVGNEQERVLPRTVYPRENIGMIDLILDKNLVTKFVPVQSISGGTIEAFSIALYRKYLGSDGIGKIQDDTYKVSPIRSIPIGSDGYSKIPFFRWPEQYPSISLKDVLAKNYSPDFFKNKIVLVGEYGTLIHDAFFAPVDFGKRMPGVEFHANIIDSLLTGRTLRDIPASWQFAFGGTISLITFATIIYSSLLVGILYGAFFPVILLIVGWYLFSAEWITLDLFFFLIISYVSPLFFGTLYRYFILDSKRRFIARAFSHYIAPEVVSKIVASPESFTLWGEKRNLTVLFSDIAGFTSISESLGTDKIFTLITEYLSEMTDILVKNNGTLDKYIGDAVMGFYGAPYAVENPEYLACKTALEQQERLSILREKWIHQWIPPVYARIGIHAGEAIVGNIGSKNRFNYTAMGDTVNLASRLEGINKAYGSYICVSESVYEKVANDFDFRFLDKIRVKGKKEWVKIYELLGYKSPRIDHEKIERYEAALDLYFAEKYAEARVIFDSIGEDIAAKSMSERIEKILSGKATVENGVYAFEEK